MNITTRKLMQEIREAKLLYAAEGFIIRGVFGSYARGDFDDQSDVDIAFSLEQQKFFSKHSGFASASRLAEIAAELSLTLGKRVDLFSLNSPDKKSVNKVMKEMLDA